MSARLDEKIKQYITTVFEDYYEMYLQKAHDESLEEFDALVANRQSVSGSVLDRMVEELRSMKRCLRQ